MAHKVIGKRYWAVAEGYIPDGSTGPQPEMLSHETLCFLNTNDLEANVEIMIYFSDRDPVGPYRIKVPPKRTKHVRFNDLEKPEPVPKGTDYASTVVSDLPIVVQHTRIDTRQAENGLFSTIAYSDKE